MRIRLLGCLLIYLVKSLVFNGTLFEQITVKQCPTYLGIPMTWNHLVSNAVHNIMLYIRTNFMSFVEHIKVKESPS